MSFRKSRILLALAPVVAVAAIGTAVAQTAPATQHAPWSTVAQKLEALGYTILELDREHNGYEADVITRDGRHLELDLDKAGKVIRERLDD